MTSAPGDHATRSVLCLPASVPRFVEKARVLAADVVIVDLEDSVAPALKESARAAAVADIANGPWHAPARAIRINALGSRWAREDLAALAGCAAGLSEIVVPKVHSVHELDEIARALDAVERRAGVDPGSIGIQIQIEDAQGLSNVDLLAGHPRITTLAFGPVDFTASLGIRTEVAGEDTTGVQAEVFAHALMRVVIAARANGKSALDGPHPAISDLEGLIRAATRAAALGCDGKWVLHPDQVDVVNQVFTPSEREVTRARAILASTTAPQGAVLLDGEMVDEATRKQALAVLARAEAGRTPLSP